MSGEDKRPDFGEAKKEGGYGLTTSVDHLDEEGESQRVEGEGSEALDTPEEIAEEIRRGSEE